MSKSSSSSPSTTGNVPNCYCSVPCVVKTTWKQPKPGRKFYGCSNFPDGCRFATGFDQHWYESGKLTAAELRGRLNTVESELMELHFKMEVKTEELNKARKETEDANRRVVLCKDEISVLRKENETLVREQLIMKKKMMKAGVRKRRLKAISATNQHLKTVILILLFGSLFYVLLK